jgi:Ca-activated chloride channel family protein
MTEERLGIQLHLEKVRLAAGASQTVDVLVRVAPPNVDISEAKRPKLNIGIALDRSGSMAGSKMREAREAAKYCVDQMLPSDIFSAVIFDDVVGVLFTSQAVENREMLKRGIDRIEARNSTALHQGWVEAGLQVSERLDPNAINRVLLITDGQANVGETNPARIIEHARSLAARSVSTSTIGIGTDFNEDLLMPMAEAGQGNAWHVQEPEDMKRIFETELNGLLMQFGHTATLAITPMAGVVVEDVLNDFEKDARGRFILPNLMYGSPLNIVVRLKVPAGNVGDITDLAEFSVSYISQASNEPRTETARLTAGFESKHVVDGLPSNTDVLEAVTLLNNARARREMMEHIDAGRYAAAASTLKSVAGDTEIAFARVHSPKLAEELSDLNDLRPMLAEADISTRKRMAYRRESTRKGK